jgi:hypothetical protein
MICITERIFNDFKVGSSAKLFLSFINSTGKNNLKNNEYASLFKVSIMTINNWCNELERLGYITIKYYKKERQIVINDILNDYKSN